MNPQDKPTRYFQVPWITPARIITALVVAVAADLLQLIVPIPGADQVIDVGAMALTVLAVGFHPLLLPTFIVEFVPIAGMLPTWTACVVAVIALRRRAQRGVRVPPLIPPDKSGSTST